MKKIIVLTGCLYIAFFANAQKYYQRMFNVYNAWESAFHLVHYDSASGAMNIVGTTIDVLAPDDDSSLFNGIFFTNINQQGDVAKTKLYRKKHINYLIGLDSWFENGLLLLPITLEDTLQKREEYILYIDTSTFETVKSIRLNKTNPNFITETLYYNGKWYCMGLNGLLSSSNPLFMVFDSLGNQIVHKTFNSNKGGAQYNLKLTDDKHILVGGYFRPSTQSSFEDKDWYLLMDTLGTLLWEHTVDTPTIDNRSRGVSVYCIQKHCYIIGRNYHDYPRYAYVSEINVLTGTPIWTKRFYQTRLEDENSYLIPGINKEHNNASYNTGYYVTEDSQYASLYKIDTSGDIVWKRLYKEFYYDNILNRIEFVPDGIVLLGESRDTLDPLKQNGWVIKTDTLGCVVPGCHLYNGVPQVIGKKVSFFVYPNPATSQLQINFTFIERYKEMELLVVNSEGKEMVKQRLVNTKDAITLKVEDWPIGLYVVNFFFEGQIVGKEKVIISR